ncbi:MAG: nickel-responsive transcriptional regulator NikR [Bacteroidales bacterium]|nr:nickel-responsive transcriptional regulator NikR [Bacteroidales bacterium]
MSVARFGVSLEKELLEELDQYVQNNRFSNRSQAIRQLIQKNLVEKKWQCNNIVAGSVNLVYMHSKKDIISQLAGIQHEYHDAVLSSQQFLIDKDHTMEVVAVKGKAARLTELADKLIAVKGIEHGKLTMSKAD